MPKKKLDGLPQYLYQRGQRLWMRYRDMDGAWTRRKTPYTIDQVDQAVRYVGEAIRAIADQRRQGTAATQGTFRDYAERWLADRAARKIQSAMDERSRIDHALPHLGHLQLDEVRPRHVRDMVRAFKIAGELAARTIVHVFNTVHNIFESAVIDELLTTNPAIVKKGELPKKVDADPEWRSRATFTVREVERLISDPIIPPERRVMYAMKALAGMRHGEVAAFCWRHRDCRAEPAARLNIVQSFNSRLGKIKSTKNEETRAVPEHPVLAKLLSSWRLEHWPRVYGRVPTDDDFVVPARTGRPISVKDAGEAMKRDLRALGLRVEAGKLRDRGGHDLRSWYMTRLIEDGADSLIIRRTTHAPPKDVTGGYERFSWKTVCREVEKLKVSLLDGAVLTLGTSSEHVERKAGNRWRNVVTPLGLEPDRSSASSLILVESSTGSDARERIVKQPRVPAMGTTADQLEKAAREGDMPRVLEIAARMRSCANVTPSENETPAEREHAHAEARRVYR